MWWFCHVWHLSKTSTLGRLLFFCMSLLISEFKGHFKDLIKLPCFWHSSQTQEERSFNTLHHLFIPIPPPSSPSRRNWKIARSWGNKTRSKHKQKEWNRGKKKKMGRSGNFITMVTSALFPQGTRSWWRERLPERSSPYYGSSPLSLVSSPSLGGTWGTRAAGTAAQLGTTRQTLAPGGWRLEETYYGAASSAASLRAWWTCSTWSTLTSLSACCRRCSSCWASTWRSSPWPGSSCDRSSSSALATGTATTTGCCRRRSGPPNPSPSSWDCSPSAGCPSTSSTASRCFTSSWRSPTSSCTWPSLCLTPTRRSIPSSTLTASRTSELPSARSWPNTSCAAGRNCTSAPTAAGATETRSTWPLTLCYREPYLCLFRSWISCSLRFIMFTEQGCMWRRTDVIYEL